MSSIFLNYIPIEEIGLSLEEGSPIVGGFGRERASLEWPGMTGHVPSRTSATKPRVLRFVFNTARTLTMADRKYILRYLSDLFVGLIEVRIDDGLSRRIMGYCTLYDAAVNAPEFVNIAPKITLEITCYAAHLEDLEQQQFAIGSTPVRIPVGTAGHGGLLFVTGANSSPYVATYRNVAGTVLGYISCTPALAAGESMLIDLDVKQFAKVSTTGVRTSVPTWNTGTKWFKVMPRDCNREMNVMATLEANAATWYRYRLKWEN